ncbi:GrpB family protein [Terricaulis sp.]|uniref:GrpB family protein n=1 Tax=Terricaulis sp. TaxID=2768686 RepID=UPI0037839041
MKTIRPHDPRWTQMFAAEAQAIAARLGKTALQIDHIGSTAIPDIFAKPVIDILVRVTSLSDLDARTAAMTAIGYEPRGEHGIAGRRYYKKKIGASGVGFHVHCYPHESEQIARHLHFRDLLLLEPDVAAQYSALKQSLANADGVLVADYAARKAEFVRRVQDAATLRFAGNGVPSLRSRH